jgi:hypothetical protein
MVTVLLRAMRWSIAVVWPLNVGRPKYRDPDTQMDRTDHAKWASRRSPFRRISHGNA